MQYEGFMHEVEVLIYPLANAVAEGKMTADGARELFEPYREYMPWLSDPEEMEEYENRLADMDHFMDWDAGPGTSDFWEAADKLGIPSVYYNEGEPPDGNPVFYLYREEALNELREALAGRYNIVVPDQADHDTSASSDPEEAKRIIEQARDEST